MNEPNRYVLKISCSRQNTWEGYFRCYVWAYSAADAKLQVEIENTDSPCIGTRCVVRSIEAYREQDHGAWPAKGDVMMVPAA